MEGIFEFLNTYLGPVCTILGGLVIIATAIVRLTPSKSDDVAVEGIAGAFWKFVAYLPTLGLNPNTKKLKEFYDEQQKQK